MFMCRRQTCLSNSPVCPFHAPPPRRPSHPPPTRNKKSLPLPTRQQTTKRNSPSQDLALLRKVFCFFTCGLWCSRCEVYCCEAGCIVLGGFWAPEQFPLASVLTWRVRGGMGGYCFARGFIAPVVFLGANDALRSTLVGILHSFSFNLAKPGGRGGYCCAGPHCISVSVLRTAGKFFAKSLLLKRNHSGHGKH